MRVPCGLQGSVVQLVASFPALSFVLSQNGLCDGWFFQPPIVAVSVLGVWGAACASWRCSHTLRTHSSKQLPKKAGVAAQLISTSRYRATSPKNCSHGTPGPWGSHQTCSQEPVSRVGHSAPWASISVLLVGSDDASIQVCEENQLR